VSSSAKWESEHMATLGAKVPKETAEQFREKAAKDGKTVNAVLRELIQNYIHKESRD